MKTKGAVVVFVFLYSALLVKAAANVPFDGYLILDGNDDIATTNISVSTGDEITVETFFLLETGSNS
ncbi:MAG: hypothetical protein JW726_08035, partial [Anaerolineales bacterium]|nr:hypothetical protein [Anaerolineales bacterium]